MPIAQRNHGWCISCSLSISRLLLKNFVAHPVILLVTKMTTDEILDLPAHRIADDQYMQP